MCHYLLAQCSVSPLCTVFCYCCRMSLCLSVFHHRRVCRVYCFSFYTFLLPFFSILSPLMMIDRGYRSIHTNTHTHTHTHIQNKQTNTKKKHRIAASSSALPKRAIVVKKYPRKKEKAKVKLRRTYKLKRVIIALLEDGYSLSHFSCRSVDQLIVYSVCICVYL
uniref:Uncharacterized protein n=1 Tax=Anopheles arabiensis TaxID=7173 RepID=A0A182HZ41_ANOAR